MVWRARWLAVIGWGFPASVASANCSNWLEGYNAQWMTRFCGTGPTLRKA